MDTHYPPKRSPRMPPLPIGRRGEKAAQGFDTLGWHWWPVDAAINSVMQAERRDEQLDKFGGTDMTTEATSTLPPDTLNEIGVLKRREIEARIIGPIVEALAKEFDRERVLAIVAETIINVARKQGAERATAMGDDSVIAFANSAGDWRKGNALEIEVLEQNEERYDFNVTRCRYAEMYRSLGMAELGAVLSCNRDYSLVEGFNPEIKLERKQTIMQGAPCCTFRYSKQTATT